MEGIVVVVSSIFFGKGSAFDINLVLVSTRRDHEQKGRQFGGHDHEPKGYSHQEGGLDSSRLVPCRGSLRGFKGFRVVRHLVL